MNWESEWERQLERADVQRQIQIDDDLLAQIFYDFDEHPAIAALKEALLNERLKQETLKIYREKKNEPHPQ